VILGSKSKDIQTRQSSEILKSKNSKEGALKRKKLDPRNSYKTKSCKTEKQGCPRSQVLIGHGGIVREPFTMIVKLSN
jgi:hypothetical protein